MDDRSAYLSKRISSNKCHPKILFKAINSVVSIISTSFLWPVLRCRKQYVNSVKERKKWRIFSSKIQADLYTLSIAHATSPSLAHFQLSRTISDEENTISSFCILNVISTTLPNKVFSPECSLDIYCTTWMNDSIHRHFPLSSLPFLRFFFSHLYLVPFWESLKRAITHLLRQRPKQSPPPSVCCFI